MKKIVWAILSLCMFLPAAAQIKWNVKAGVGASDFRKLDAMNSVFSYRVGVGFDIPFRFTNWAVQPTLYFATKGAKFTGFYGSEQITEAEFRNRLHYLELPIMAVYKLRLAENVRMHFMAGPYVGLGISGRSSVKDPNSDFHKTFSGNLFVDDAIYDDASYFDAVHNPVKSSAYNRFDVGLSGGLGLYANHLLFGVEGMWGLNSVCEDLMAEKMKNFAFYLTLGYQF